MKTPVEALLGVVGIGGSLRIVSGELRMVLPATAPSELKDDIREHKPALLKLMGLTFLIVRSSVLSAIVFFVPDDAIRRSLVLAGADPGTIYTRTELGALIASRITPTELRLIHAAKQQFNGEVRD